MKGTFSHTIWSRYYLKALLLFCLAGVAAMLVIFDGFPKVFYVSGSAVVSAIFGVFILSFFQTSRNHLNQQVTVSFLLMLVVLHQALFFAPEEALVQTCFIIGSLGYAMLLGKPEHLRIYLAGQTLFVIVNVMVGAAAFEAKLPFLSIYVLASGFYYLLINRMLKKQRELWLLKVRESNIRAELELQSEQLKEVQHVHDLTRSMTCVADYTGYFIEANEAFCEKLGFTKEELCSKPFIDFVHPDDVEKTKNLASSLSSDFGSTPDFINRYVCKDGSVVYFQWNASVDESRSKIYCVVTDVTSQKQSEEALRAYQTRLKALFDQNTVGITLATLDGNIVMANPAMERVLGYQRSELTKKSIQDLTLQADRHIVSDCIYLLTSGENNSYTFEKRCQRKDGTICWVRAEIGLMKSEHGKPDYLVCTVIDISEQKEAEAALRSSQAYLLQAQEIGKIGHWAVNVSDLKPIWSEEIYRIHEVEMGEEHSLEGAIDFYDDDSREIMTDSFAKCMSEGKSFDLVLGINTAKGNHKWVRAIGSPQYEEREIVRVFGIFQDVTKQVEFEQELREARVQAEQAAQAKTMFLSNMSHEIRTPLNALIGSTHLMLQDQPRPDQKEMLEIMQFSGNNLLSLVNDILDYNKIEAGKLPLESIEIDVRKLMSTITQGHQYKAKERRIDLTLEIDESTPNLIKGDPTRVTQIINNLTSNAIKFTENGGVVIRTSATQLDDHRVSLAIEVKDTGIGIPEDKREEVFGSFIQASSETTRKYGGTGLGLAISRNLAELMGGTITLISEEGKGSVFTATIEAEICQRSASIPAREVELNEELPLKGVKVLLVEDNMVNVKIASRFLKKWGADIMLATNGQEAVKHARQTHSDVILMDIRMPVMGGEEATETIRTFNQETPIIALTASTLTEVREEFQGKGFNGFVTKPFRPAELLKEIRNLVGVRATH